MTAREALDHPWLAPVREFAAKRRAEEMGTTPIAHAPSSAPLLTAAGEGGAGAGAGARGSRGAAAGHDDDDDDDDEEEENGGAGAGGEGAGR